MALTSRSHFLAVAYRLEEVWDRSWSRFKRWMGWLDPVTIQPYRGYGDGLRIRARARVLEENGVSKAWHDRGAFGNLMQMVRRFESDEIAGAKVKIGFDKRSFELASDGEGYLDIAMDGLDMARPDSLAWQNLSLELVEPYHANQPKPFRVEGPVLIPPASPDFAVISDIDDTILKTGATNLLRNLRTTLLSSLDQRSPFLGIATFYKALQEGKGASSRNPIFYVSSSPWNLYDFLEAFMDRNDIPIGPMFLRDLGLDENKFIESGHGDHKLKAITTLLDFYTDLNFILIGDSGQHDVEIYRDAVKRHPGRIKAVYIRALDEAPDRDAPAQELLDEIERSGVQTALCSDLLLAAKSAAGQGWIDASAIDEIQAEVEIGRSLERR